MKPCLSFNELLINVMCCAMCVDLRVDKREVQTICTILKELDIPMIRKQLEPMLNSFIARVRSQGILYIVEQTLNQIRESPYKDKSHLLMDCIDRVIKSDRFIDPREIEFIQKFKTSVSNVPQYSNAFDIKSDLNSSTESNSGTHTPTPSQSLQQKDTKEKKVIELVGELNSLGILIAFSKLPSDLALSLRNELRAARENLNSDHEATATQEEIDLVKKAMDAVCNRIPDGSM